MLTITGVTQVKANQCIFPVSRCTGVQTHQWHIGDGEVPWLPSDLD